MQGFDVNAFIDSAPAYSVFDDVAENMDFAACGIDTSAPVEDVIKPVQPIVPTPRPRPTDKAEAIKNKTVTALGKRGRKSGSKGKCGACGLVGHYKPKCPTV